MLALETFVATQTRLLSLEKETESEQSKDLFNGLSGSELEKQGICVTKLYPASVATGLYGRRVITFSRDDLPNHSFSSGDLAGVAHKDLSMICEGVVSKVGKDNIAVAFDEVVDDSILSLNKVNILKLTNNVTYRRYEKCLKKLGKCEHQMVEKLITSNIKLTSVCPSDCQVDFHNKSLNSGQRSAVQLSLSRSDLTLVHGPPGTGKTTTLVEIIRQHVDRKEKVLVCAPSNIAVDNLLVKLAPHCSVVRVGHPARVNHLLIQYSLDAQLKRRDEDNILGDIRKDIDKIISQSRGGGDKKYISRSGLGDLKKELREREYKVTKEVLCNSQVVLSTLTSAGGEGPLGKLPAGHFSVCVIDEASQALEVACWIGMLNAKKIVLAGDHCQLPPTIKSDKAAKEGLEVTLMERIVNSASNIDEVCAKLTEQYRMNSKIMNWSSREMYSNLLTAHSSVAGHVLQDLDHVTATVTVSRPLCYIDTAGAGLAECHVGVSRGNAGEAAIVVEYIEELLAAGVEQNEIAVITPYNLQIELVKTAMSGRFRDIEVCTVDGFQGREKEAVIISLVRSNERGDIGFLSERRRMNVAVTRARRHVCVIGDSLTVTRDNFLNRMIGYFREHAIVRSAFEFEQIQPETVNVHKTSDDETEKHENKSEKRQPSIPKTDEISFKQKCMEELTKFKESEKDETKFVGLNSYQRRIIHCVCEDLAIFSQSNGSGDKRDLLVKKTEFTAVGTTGNTEGTNDKSNLEDGEEGEKSEETALKLVVCRQCGKRLPENNLQLHQIRCKPFTTKEPAQKKPAKQNKKKTVTKKEKPGPAPDDLTLLEQSIENKLLCYLVACKHKTLSYMDSCQFCSRCYCTAHKLPESHGCGSAARQAARLPSTSTSIRAATAAKSRLQAQLRDKAKERTKKRK